MMEYLPSLQEKVTKSQVWTPQLMSNSSSYDEILPQPSRKSNTITSFNTTVKGYLHYKIIFSYKVVFDVQLMNYSIEEKTMFRSQDI